MQRTRSRWAGQVEGAEPRRRAGSPAWLGVVLGAAVGLGVLAGGFWGPSGLGLAQAHAGDPPVAAGHAAGLASIRAASIAADVEALAAEQLEGRDTPSQGLRLAAAHIAARLQALGYRGLGPEGTLEWPFELRVPDMVPDGCELRLVKPAGHASAPPEDDPGRSGWVLGHHFVPVQGSGGRARGELCFVGFGIRAPGEGFDELSGRALAGRVAVILEGEPEHAELLEGPAVSRAANLYSKLHDLERADVAGVLVVRKASANPGSVLGFRHTWAEWQRERRDAVESVSLPVLEITAEVAQELFGADVWAWGAGIEATGRPLQPLPPGPWVELAAAVESRSVVAHNVVAWWPGSDEQLAHECVVLGAHYDHVGVDPRGRIGRGADDNASGVSAMLAMAEALAGSRPRRSVLVCAFAGEEDGLVGSRALTLNPPVPLTSMVAMLNLDMVGRGDPREVAVIGLLQNPGLNTLLRRAQALSSTGVTEVVVRQGQELFDRSDHFSFHRARVPTLFFFEGLPITRNPDYHTWRDDPEQLDVQKIAATARLAFNAAWLLANDADRPPHPEH